MRIVFRPDARSAAVEGGVNLPETFLCLLAEYGFQNGEPSGILLKCHPEYRSDELFRQIRFPAPRGDKQCHLRSYLRSCAGAVLARGVSDHRPFFRTCPEFRFHPCPGVAPFRQEDLSRVAEAHDFLRAHACKGRRTFRIFFCRKGGEVFKQADKFRAVERGRSRFPVDERAVAAAVTEKPVEGDDPAGQLR